MKGVLFTVLEDCVTEEFGPDLWDEVLLEADSDGVYTSLGDYGDDEFARLVDAVAGRLGISAGEALVFAGQRGFPLLAQRHQQILASIPDWQTLLRSLDHIIHPEVRKIYRGSIVPEFTVTEVGHAVTLTYRSVRSLCRLAEGLSLGALAWFDRTGSVRHESCRAFGDPECRLTVRES